MRSNVTHGLVGGTRKGKGNLIKKSDFFNAHLKRFSLGRVKFWKANDSRHYNPHALFVLNFKVDLCLSVLTYGINLS